VGGILWRRHSALRVLCGLCVKDFAAARLNTENTEKTEVTEKEELRDEKP
jgi:hypothetical protein